MALSLPGNILSDVPDARWGRLVWTCCVAAGGQWEEAMAVAAAVELFMVALDVLDDVEDGEATLLSATLGVARALNISTGLLLLAQHGLYAASGGTIAAAILLDAGLHAGSGQHADLSAGHVQGTSLEDALTVTAEKSAVLVAAVCRLGALCAEADMRIQKLYARFGWHLGMILQLKNDIAALQPDATHKTDLVPGRPTVPLTHAALIHAARNPNVADAMAYPSLQTHEPIYVTWVVAETYRQHATTLIPQLTADGPCRTALAALLQGR